MDILIKNHSAAESIAEQAQIRAKLYLRKIRILLLIGFGFALLLIAVHFFQSKEYAMVRAGKNTIYYKLNMFLSLGIGLTLVFGYLSLKTIQLKKRIIRDGILFSNQFHSKNEYEIRINEQEVTFSSHVLSQTINWKLFRNYSLHGNYLLLNLEMLPFYSIAIDRRLLSEEDFRTVKQFAAQKLRKI